MLILYVREIAIKIRILMFISNILRALCTFCPLNVSYYQKCSQTMAKWNGNERQISFGPKYLLKLIRYTVKNVIKNLDILFKSSFKMQEMPFKRLELQIFSKEACPLTPLEMCRQFSEYLLPPPPPQNVATGTAPVSLCDFPAGSFSIINLTDEIGLNLTMKTWIKAKYIVFIINIYVVKYILKYIN